MTKLDLVRKFAIESNTIESELDVHPDQIMATMCAIKLGGIQSEERLLGLHKMMTAHLNVPWSGKYRTIQVTVDKHVPPDPFMVPFRMQNFFLDLPEMDAWTAHNVFEDIHPFQDFNGRMGRLIWLSKAWKDEKYRMEIPFLHMYYYQTLRHHHKK